MHLHYVVRRDWPTLAWLAKCTSKSSAVTIYHGHGVEAGDSWYCEAVWAGDYRSGGFDRTDIIAGSGGRLRGGTLRFVSSGSTIDRLQSLHAGDGTCWVSNSLPCLLAAVGGAVDPIYTGYYRDANSIIEGLDRYKRTLATSAGPVQLTYFDNLCWNGASLDVEPKPVERRDFSTYSKYREFLTTNLAATAENAGAPERTFQLRLLGTLSSGYDSTAVSVLARPLGMDEVITFDRARQGDSDSGETAARLLGLRCRTFEREAWRTQELAEIPFIASYSSAEDIPFAGAEAVLSGRVLMTGYHGDKFWDKFTKNLSDQVVRGDSSGLALTEYRLRVGFVNCAIAFWGARQIRQINELSNSQEMKPWDVEGGYSRPICRRIGEEAGIPRDAFGIRKRAVTVNPYAGWDVIRSNRNLLTPASLADYLQWISANRKAWVSRGRVPPIPSAQLNYCINALHMKCIDAANSVGKLPLVWRLGKYRLYTPQYLNQYLFPWALERAMQRYSAPLAQLRTAAA